MGITPDLPAPESRPRRTIRTEVPSHLTRRETNDSINQARHRWDSIRERQPDVVHQYHKYRDDYEKHHRHHLHRHFHRITGHYHNRHHRYFYSHYFRHGFFGGFYYPVRPCYDIHVYFGFPIVTWLFTDSVNPSYYRHWYDDYDRYPVKPFRSARVFFPTDTLRDLGIEVSAFPSETQRSFRAAIVKLTEMLAQELANDLGTPITLRDSDVVMNRYENLRDQAVMIEGFVDRADIKAPFKALLDLADSEQTLIYIPVNQEPTHADLGTLERINQRILSLGGDPYLAYEEPLRAVQRD